jgi:hypothetical protein
VPAHRQELHGNSRIFTRDVPRSMHAAPCHIQL